MVIWIDGLYLKTSSFLTYKYEFTKILLHTILAYKTSKIVISKINLETKFHPIKPNTIFLCVFLLINSYIICQYTTRAISNRVLNYETRTILYDKTNKLGPAGWGFECDSMSYQQFKEITKYTNLPDLPIKAEHIYVYDWSEFDYRRIIKFRLHHDYPIDKFYKKNPSFKDNLIINEIEYDEKTFKPINYDKENFDRYKWEVSDP